MTKRTYQPRNRQQLKTHLIHSNTISIFATLYIPMKFGVVVFPGSNCDHDAWYAVSRNLGQQADFIWHDSDHLGSVDAVILPGGFSYGDYLRCGAIAKYSPVMNAVRKFSQDGGLVIGICNGFQILVEAGLLPGALVRNAGLKFRCHPVDLRVETSNSPFTNASKPGAILLNGENSNAQSNLIATAAKCPLNFPQRRLEPVATVTLHLCRQRGSIPGKPVKVGNSCEAAKETEDGTGRAPIPARATSSGWLPTSPLWAYSSCRGAIMYWCGHHRFIGQWGQRICF